MSLLPGGIWPAMLTPFDDQGRVALPVVDRLVEAFVAEGLEGLYITGSTGQWPLLEFAERRAIAERTVQAAAGRIAVMVHVGAVRTADAVALAKHAEQIGASAVSCVAPIYYPTSADQVFEHYRRIGEASALPLYVYHLGLVNQISLGAAAYVQRLLEIPGIAGMKFTDSDLYLFGLLVRHAQGRLRIYSGADELLCQAAVCGAVGAIGTFFNLWGSVARTVRARFIAGDFRVGCELMQRLQEAIRAVIDSRSIWTFLRAAMQHKHGIDIGLPRAPVGSMDRPWSAEDVARTVALVDGSGC